MSILLEALRKSEKNQRVRETPTIHSDAPSAPVTERLQTVPLALLLIVTLFVSGWFVWRQYQVPEGTYQPPVSLDADRNRTGSKPVVVDKPVEPVAPLTPGASTSSTSVQGRTPVESYRPPDNGNSAAAAGAQVTATTGAGDSVTNPTGAEQKTNESPTAPSLEPAENNTTAGAEKESFHPGEPAPIGYWELPDSIRAEVPEIKFSVLVFASDPADRFVLINGQRFGEGDSVQSGLMVKEIRREGVVFSYRLYQFLVER